MKIEKEKIKKKYRDWKSLGYTIVFTNGCFDLLHQGHIDLLSKAATYGDRLIVGLNSDKSVKNLKGESRPIQTQDIRKNRLVRLNYVDSVHIFEENTPLKLIQIIKPDVLVKGGDYKKEEIIGNSEIASWGGRIEIIPLTPGYSTTEILKKNKMEGLV